MRKLEAEPEIVSMALALTLDPRLGALKEIVNFCRAKVAKIAAKVGKVTTLEELQSAVAAHLCVVFEEIWSDDDLTAVVKKYVAMGEFVFADLPNQLDHDTFASLIEREHIKAGAQDRYIAVIDCRGEKAARRYFTRWHELAHILTFVKQLELPFIRHRSTKTHQDPTERLMDTIAGDVGFFDPLFAPALREELSSSRFLTFDGIQRVRDRMCPTASYQAALIACTTRNPNPTVVLQVEMAFKKCEEQAVRSHQMQMFGTAPPKAKLRAVESTQNPAARSAGLIIHRNMAIPAASLVTKYFEQTGKAEQANAPVSGEENLSIWRHSDGKAIGFGPVHIVPMARWESNCDCPKNFPSVSTKPLDTSKLSAFRLHLQTGFGFCGAWEIVGNKGVCEKKQSAAPLRSAAGNGEISSQTSEAEDKGRRLNRLLLRSLKDFFASNPEWSGEHETSFDPGSSPGCVASIGQGRLYLGLIFLSNKRWRRRDSNPCWVSLRVSPPWVLGGCALIA